MHNIITLSRQDINAIGGGFVGANGLKNTMVQLTELLNLNDGHARAVSGALERAAATYKYRAGVAMTGIAAVGMIVTTAQVYRRVKAAFAQPLPDTNP